jgi:negative regulator of sigma E activity
MSDTTEHKPAASIAVLDLHLDYLRRDVAKLVEAVGNMATKADIEHLSRRMDTYATKDEVRALEAKVQSGSVPSTVDRWLTAVTKVGAAAAVLCAAAASVAALVHFLDRVPVK